MAQAYRELDITSVANHILIVDDDPQAADAARNAFERQGLRVTIARDGGQAHSTLVMKRPDFVVLELILPGENGFEICEHIKQIDRRIPVLVVSVIDMPDAQALAERVGADGYLRKPCEADVLVAAVRDVAQRVWERHHLDQVPAEEARVRFQCSCGKRFKMMPAHRGRTLSCPGCGETLIVPRHD